MTENVSTTDVVTSLTFIDLPLFSYDDFQDELTFTHARLQHVSTGNKGDSYFCFLGLVWWYSITEIPEDPYSPNNVWHLLNGPGAYQSMLNKFINAQDFADVTLELTNNLEYTTSEMTLPASKYPCMTVEVNTGSNNGNEDDERGGGIEAKDVTIFPAYFRLSRAPQISFPTSSEFPMSVESLSYTPFSAQNLRNFNENFPPGLCLTPTASASELNPRCVQFPINAIVANPSTPLVTTSSMKPPPPSPSKFQPASQQPHASLRSESPTLPSSQALHPPLPPQQQDVDTDRGNQHNSYITASNGHPKTHTQHPTSSSFLIYTRPPHQLGRRYSIPFDRSMTSHGATLKESQATYITTSNPSSYSSANLGFKYAEHEKLNFGEAQWVVPDFGIFGGLGDGTAV